jgi:hypothetical protein
LFPKLNPPSRKTEPEKLRRWLIDFWSINIILMPGRKIARVAGGSAKESQMSQSTRQKGKAFVVEGFETLFNKKHFVEAEKLRSSNVWTRGVSPSARRSPSSTEWEVKQRSA